MPRGTGVVRGREGAIARRATPSSRRVTGRRPKAFRCRTCATEATGGTWPTHAGATVGGRTPTGAGRQRAGTVRGARRTEPRAGRRRQGAARSRPSGAKRATRGAVGSSNGARAATRRRVVVLAGDEHHTTPRPSGTAAVPVAGTTRTATRVPGTGVTRNIGILPASARN